MLKLTIFDKKTAVFAGLNMDAYTSGKMVLILAEKGMKAREIMYWREV